MSQLLIDPSAKRPRAKEADTVKAIDQLLQYRGWLCIPTPAEALHPSGGRIHKRGHADRAYVRSLASIEWDFSPGGHRGGGCQISFPQGAAQFMFAELKRPKANTQARRRADQAQWELEMKTRGFVTYRCPEGEADPLEHFRAWYKAQWNEEL